VIFPGQLRNLKNTIQILSKISNSSDVWFVIQRGELGAFNEIKTVYPNVLSVFLEDYITEGVLKDINVRSMQFLKLSVGLDCIAQYERQKGFQYQMFLKLRTDYSFRYLNTLLDFSKESKANNLYCVTDLIFSGNRDVFFQLRGLFQFCQMVDRSPNRYLPLNQRQIADSDDCFKWFWFALPKSYTPTKNFAGLDRFLMAGDDEVSRRREFIVRNLGSLSGYGLINEEAGAYAQGNTNFSAERLFAYYLNMIGLVVKSDIRFSGKLLKS
jgi:hypothetical protein